MQDDEEGFLLSLSAEERTSILRRKEKEMDETDPLVRDTGGQEVQRKVLRFPGYRGKGVSERHLFFWRSKITWGHKILSFKQCGVVDAPHCFEAS